MFNHQNPSNNLCKCIRMPWCNMEFRGFLLTKIFWSHYWFNLVNFHFPKTAGRRWLFKILPPTQNRFRRPCKVSLVFSWWSTFFPPFWIFHKCLGYFSSSSSVRFFNFSGWGQGITNSYFSNFFLGLFSSRN